MKKTFTINISGTVFHIEDDAYEKLQDYLLKLKMYFGSDDEGKEVVADIENRIAELFSEKPVGENVVVTMEWVDEVIKVIGMPEDFGAAEDDEPVTATGKRKRRLYRDPGHRVLGGVCGGLGAYFNIDPVVLRIIFVVLFFINGIGFLAYIILWIAVPKAVNTAQRLEMRGQEVTISNIEKSIKDEVKEVQESVQRLKKSDTYAKGQHTATQVGDVAYNILKVLLKIVVIIIGVILIISGFFGLLGFISSMVVGHSLVADWPLVWSPDLQMYGFLGHFVTPGALTLGLAAIGFLAGIPLLAMLFIGTKLVFRYKSNNTAIILSMAGVWLISLITLVVLSVGQAGNFKDKTSLSTSQVIDCQSCQTLYLELGEDKWGDYSGTNWKIDRFKVVNADGEQILIGKPKLDIEKSSTGNFIVNVKKKSRGGSQSDARENIESITYNFSQKDSTLSFDPYFIIGGDGRWREQEVFITVKVPEGKAVYLSESLVKIIYDIENVSNTWDGDMIGKFWEMRPEGLVMKKEGN